MSPCTTVRKGFAAKALTVALLGALTLAGCAAEPPVDPASGLPPPCDLVCRLLRLLDLDEPPPPPPAAPPTPPVRPRPTPARAAHASRRQAMPPLRPTLAAPLATGGPAPPPPLAPFQSPPSPSLALAPAGAGPAGALPADGMPAETLPGSPGIAPPWFEPWTSPGQP